MRGTVEGHETMTRKLMRKRGGRGQETTQEITWHTRTKQCTCASTQNTWVCHNPATRIEKQDRDRQDDDKMILLL